MVMIGTQMLGFALMQVINRLSFVTVMQGKVGVLQWSPHTS